MCSQLLSQPQRVFRRVAAQVVVEIREDWPAFLKMSGKPDRPVV